MMDVSKVTRVDIIDHRAEFAPYRHDYHGVVPELVLQDDGRTLKVFIRDHPDATAESVRQSVVESATADMVEIRDELRSVVRRRLTE